MKLLLLLVGIPALLVGLMAMHILSPETEPAPTSYSLVEAAAPAESGDPTSATLHDVVTFVCVLILALGLLFVLPVGSVIVALARRLALVHLARSQRPHWAPTLELLSLSRR